MRKRTVIVIVLAVVLAGAGVFAYLVSRGLDQVAHLEPGMVTIQLPSGVTVYVRRQSFFRKPAEVYLAASPDFCAPYDRSHDFKLPEVIHGGIESPLLLSYQGNAITIHGPKELQRPQYPPSSFSVLYEELTSEAYSGYVRSNQLPAGWMRIEVPFGHNTCAL
jgi:hypothetical protein